MRGLEIPLDFSGRGVEREERRSVKIGALALANPKVGVGRADRNEQHAPLFIDGGESPGIRAGAVDPFISVPDFVIGLAGPWNGVNRPDELTGMHVPSANITTGAQCRGFSGVGARNDQILIYCRRRSHAETCIRNFVADDSDLQIHHAFGPETSYRLAGLCL